MLSRILGDRSLVPELRAELDRSTRAVREIAHRVANAATGAGPDFGRALRQAEGSRGGVDLEKEMVALAEEQLRFETVAQLLQKTYQGLRSSLREG